MNTVRIYIDENLDTSHVQGLRQMLKNVPHVVNVAISDRDPHEVVVDYEERHNMPVKLIAVLRGQGYHPDILSA
ncbi:MAG: hypothetical protein GC149_08435 [Gammaproteobacteria bacterium]|nr:hypothetical protein [Gammaproteobacteria bacterium]